MASSSALALFFVVIAEFAGLVLSSQISLGSRLYANNDNQSWVSDNGTFAFGFTTTGDSRDNFQLGIWFAQLPGDRILVWSANLKSPVTKEAFLEFANTGNLVLTDKDSTVWTTNSSRKGVEVAVMSENGNLILYNSDQQITWQSFAYPSDSLLPGQTLTVSQELTSSKSPSHGGYYSLKMLQQSNSLSLGLNYHLPESYNTNYSYWSGPETSNVTGNVVALLDEGGSFGMVYGSSLEGAVYVYKNDNDSGGLSPVTNRSNRPTVLRRLTLEVNGNLRLYRWDDDVNGTRQWVSEWAAVSNPCDIGGICGNGICSLDRSKTNSSCSSLPKNSGNSLLNGKCDPRYQISVVQQTNYYYSESSIIANYSDIESVSKCGDACLTDCECVGSVYGLEDEKPYCWVLKRLEFGGFEDPGSTLFVKVAPSNNGNSDDSNERKRKVVIIPIVLSMVVLIGLFCCLLYIYVHKKRALKRALENSLIVSGAPINFSYRDLQSKTNNFTELLGTGGFGSVFKGTLSDGTLIAVKKLDRILPHGEKEFITEVNTIGSMHHMNLVRLCGYCSEGRQRALVYEFMKNGSLDQWIFPSYKYRDRLLDWPSRFRIAINTAQGIAYFHEQCRNRIIHCDIKPENILLDEYFNPKVSDFGLAKLMGRECSQVVTMIRGTRGYLAPEWISNRPITVKADVYSYGMLLLEIIGGRRNLDMSFDADEFFFPGWAFKEMTKGTPWKAVDRRLERGVDEEEVTRAIKVAFWCIQDDVPTRPSMGDVVRLLEGPINEINDPPMPQAVLEVIEEGLENVYKAMKRDFNNFSSFTRTTELSSQATCSSSTMSAR